MAAGIYDDQGKLVAGLSISAPADRLDEGWLPKLQATANEISEALGFKQGVAPAAGAVAAASGSPGGPSPSVGA
jgi:transcriptional regulator of acetoin/glycerol metabolism